jgi:hypothetical protein
MSEEITDLELNIFLASKKKSLEEISTEFRLSNEEVERLLESARSKLPQSQSAPTKAQLLLPRPTSFRLDKSIGIVQRGSMKVGSQILEVLGKGIYSQPWNSLKELISNSFDACATDVHIDYNSIEKKLIIKDSGLGMDYKDFDEHFTFITKSTKRQESDYSELYHRPVIGKIGIGVLAATELCEQMKIISAKKGADSRFEAIIDFAKIRQIENKDKEFYEVSYFSLTNYDKPDRDEHYTIIELCNLKKSFIEILENGYNGTIALSKFSNFEQAIECLCMGDYTSLRRNAGVFWEFLINLANVIPIEYTESGPVSFTETKVPKELLNDYKSSINIINEIKNSLKSYNFKVYFNGFCLKKPYSFPNTKEIVRYGIQFQFFPICQELTATDPATGKTSKIKYKGYIYYQKTKVVPEELAGLSVRIKNVAIGGPSKDFWGHPYSGDALYFPQTFGEVYVEEGLEDAMNIDRSSFKTSHHDYNAMRHQLNDFMRKTVFTRAKKMWGKRKEEKEDVQNQKKQQSRELAVKHVLGSNYAFKEIFGMKSGIKIVEINGSNKTMHLDVLNNAFQGFNKEDRTLLGDVSIALELVLRQEQNPDEIKEKFWKLLSELTTYRKTRKQ